MHCHCFYTFLFSRWWLVLGIATAVVLSFHVFKISYGSPTPLAPLPTQDEFSNVQDLKNLERVPCMGPRNTLLSENEDDQLRPAHINYPYPEPLAGYFEALALNKTWFSSESRYGPYGYVESEATNSRRPVDWSKIDWALLQDDCLARNKHRFRPTTNLTILPKLEKNNSWKSRLGFTHLNSPVRDSRHLTGRTAIVLRTWDCYEYKEEDLYNLRSLIVETTLSSGGEYAIFLLVHVRDPERNIFGSEANYAAALDELLPPELRPMAVLFDNSLLESWYPKIKDHAPVMQIFEPLQLFAQKYSDFDHYWQLEMDFRIMGDSRHYLDRLSAFARAEPRKQALERSSFLPIPQVHGNYSSLLSAVNASLKGGGVWGPVSIPEVQHPIGPSPPTASPLDDDFQWGVGEDADLIATTRCYPSADYWVFHNSVSGFALGSDTRRWFCPLAVVRASWNLLNVIHTAQVTQGLELPSEATLVSFAVWHGLKISCPPQPVFMDPPQDPWYIDQLLNGGPPRSENEGFSRGSITYNRTAFDEFFFAVQPTLRWSSAFPSQIRDAWLGGVTTAADGDQELPSMLRMHEGKVFAPNMALHPVKTNDGPGEYC